MELSFSPVKISILLCAISATLFAASRLFERDAPRAVPDEYTYRGRDYPRAWPLPPLAPVHLSHEDSVHYSIETDLGIAEWNATLPPGGAVVHLGPAGRPFTVSMLHQLRCLDIVREVIVDYYADASPDAVPKKQGLVQHCMNYLRQTVMCRGDLHIETVRAPKGQQVTVSAVTHACRDWTAVYEAAEENHAEFVRKRSEER
ncbi:hypothetical protein C8Q80DRAFT_1218764 [Daedaleopsis nitida]|nr:hypothetical protein C8Q80DRAFT_1218764 [Daedaleopsis nitida]